ncbi:MAG: saccharopine dehydrogenase C-terminal domain-containing protein [Tepidisphaeraceae bacterium]|jgi:saccharopine dehydrogenase-like NADP-dependent oxidoreductase
MKRPLRRRISEQATEAKLKYRILLLGAGKIGTAIAAMLQGSGDFDVLAGDVDKSALKRLEESSGAKTRLVSAEDARAVRGAMKGCDAVISACSFNVNPGIAAAAKAAGISYFDLTEDRQTTEKVRSISAKSAAGQIFMPQCGLAPGFVSISAFALTHQFQSLDEVRMRVGALPKFPTNEMKYNLTWSTDGLINEYGNPCEAIHDRRLIEVLPLEGLEHFSLDGVDYEAFNTSGGVGTLAQTLAGKVRTLDYKTIRYRGHRELMAFLLNELRLNDRRALLKDILEQAVPVTPQDVVLIFCTVTGRRNGLFTQVTDARKVYHGDCFGQSLSAIQISTAASLCAVVDLHAQGKLPKRGFVRQEQVRLEDFLGNRFGRVYASGSDPLLSKPAHVKEG